MSEIRDVTDWWRHKRMSEDRFPDTPYTTVPEEVMDEDMFTEMVKTIIRDKYRSTKKQGK